jgi:superoxide dismutase, Cu-Zn family
MNRILLLTLVLVVAACTREDGSRAGEPRERDMAVSETIPEKAPAAPARDAVVQLAATQGNSATGSLQLVQSPQGVRVSGAIQGLKPNGEFGFHFHEKGDCSAPDASSAGAHFNPAQKPHGNPTGEEHHAGDMSNVKSNAEGVAQIDTTADAATIGSGGPTDVMGKAVVVHEKADDYTTQPSGNSGSRIACGVIAMPTPTPG